MPKKNLLHLDLSEFSEKLLTLPVAQINKLNGILSDLANHAYDTYEFVLELPDKLKEISKKEAEKMIIDLNELQQQITPVMGLLCNMNYYSKYMDRAKDILGTIEDEIPTLVSTLKKKIK